MNEITNMKKGREEKGNDVSERKTIKEKVGCSWKGITEKKN
jgi:hypothetical protein